MWSKLTGSAKRGNPAVDRCGAAGLEQRTPDSRAMAGLRSQALRPAARSWLTGVAGPRSRKRGPHIDRTPHVERREAPLFFGREGTPSQSVPPDGFARHPSGGFAKPPRLPALRSPRGARGEEGNEGLRGADQRIRAAEHWLFDN